MSCWQHLSSLYKGSFKNYVDKFLAFFWPPTPLRLHFLPYESRNCWTTYQPLLVNIVCERPLTWKIPVSSLKTVVMVELQLVHVVVTGCLPKFKWWPENKRIQHFISRSTESCSLDSPTKFEFCFMIFDECFNQGKRNWRNCRLTPKKLGRTIVAFYV